MLSSLFPWGAKLARMNLLGCCVFCLWWGLAAQSGPRGVLPSLWPRYLTGACPTAIKVTSYLVGGWGQEISTRCQDHLLEPEQWHEVEIGLPRSQRTW